MSTAPPKNTFEKIRDTLLLPYKDTIFEIQRLFPDSVLFGSLILFITTMNSVFGYFAVFLLEIFISHKMMSWILTKFVGPLQSGSSSGSMSTCYPGFRGARKEVDRISRFNEYPSISITSISAISSYILASMITFNDTLKTMGEQWNTRFVFSLSFIAIILTSTIVFRWLMGCESVSEIGFALLFGLAIGGIFFAINKQMFGPESINFLGLPYLVDKNDQGSDIYVCAPTL
jgi:hypothetical protein